MGTVVLVCGSRHWEDPQPVEAALVNAFDRAGGAEGLMVLHETPYRTGLGRIVNDWCNRWHVHHIPFAPDWEQFGRLARARQTAAMIDFLVEQRDDMGAQVEMVVCQLGDDAVTAANAEQLARGQRIAGHTLTVAA